MKERVLAKGVFGKNIDIRFEQSELIVRFLEVALNMERPKGLPPVEAIELVRAQVEDGDELIAMMARLSDVALRYFAEQVNASGGVGMERIPGQEELQ